MTHGELDATFTFTFFLRTKLCISLGAGRVGRVEGRVGRKKAYSETIRLSFGFVRMVSLLNTQSGCREETTLESYSVEYE